MMYNNILNKFSFDQSRSHPPVVSQQDRFARTWSELVPSSRSQKAHGHGRHTTPTCCTAECRCRLRKIFWTLPLCLNENKVCSRSIPAMHADWDPECIIHRAKCRPLSRLRRKYFTYTETAINFYDNGLVGATAGNGKVRNEWKAKWKRSMLVNVNGEWSGGL